jgi:ABC-type dipeptide/oligopeptide/nickel transport system permease subunit
LAYQALNSTGIAAVVDAVLAVILRILAGVVIGVPAGYVSHVVVDSFTPKGIAATGF